MSNGMVAPGPPAPPVIGHTRVFARDPLAFYCEMGRRYGDVVQVFLAGKRCFLLNHPEHVGHVLQKNFRNYRKSATYHQMSLLIGQGLITAEGETWRQHRKIAQPAFRKHSLERLQGMMFDRAAVIVERLRPKAEAGESARALDFCMEAALDIVGHALFGMEIDADVRELGRHFEVAIRYVNGRAEAIFPLSYRIPTPARRRFRRALAYLDGVVYRTIEARRRSGEETDDLLSMLMHARDDDSGEGFSDRDLRDEVLTMMGAGYETTATAMSWTLYLLSMHPLVRERVVRQVDDAFSDPDPRDALAERTPLLTQVIQESMRLYPPVWSITRCAEEDDVIGGYAVPADSVIIASPYLTHRDPRFWDNPEGFDPSRFDPAVSPQRPRYTYFPFSVGARACIGQRFAMIEMQIVLGYLLRHFRMDVEPGVRPTLAPHIVLRPGGGVPMRLRLREG